jgi:TetR/AcrR family transcriptional regulator, mexJK operon transcriptional repressor
VYGTVRLVTARSISPTARSRVRVSERAGTAIAVRFQEARTVTKHRTIARAATELFIAKGYAETSVDDIADAAGVSKQTVYSHFESKENLFLVVTAAATDSIHEELATWFDPALGESSDLERDLLAFSRRFASLVLRPEVLALRRLVMTETVRFPEIGQAWYARGPTRAIDQLAANFQRLTERGLLAADEPRLAAENFNWLLLSGPMNRMLFGVVEKFTEHQIDQVARSAVRVFLAAYRPRPAK